MGLFLPVLVTRKTNLQLNMLNMSKRCNLLFLVGKIKLEWLQKSVSTTLNVCATYWPSNEVRKYLRQTEFMEQFLAADCDAPSNRNAAKNLWCTYIVNSYFYWVHVGT